MKLSTSIISTCLYLFVLLNSCSGQTKKIENENELSIILFNDTTAYYNGILNKDVKVTTIPFDTIAINRLLKENRDKYNDRLRVFIKVSNKTTLQPAAIIKEIAETQQVFAAVFPLTEADKFLFKVDEFAWEPPLPVEIISSSPSVTVTEIEDFPGFIVVIKKDNSVWYNAKTAKDDTLLAKVDEPIKENLKKIIAAYKENVKNATYYIKGDNSLKYPQFKETLGAFKENDIFKFQMITMDGAYYPNPEEIEIRTQTLIEPKDEPKKTQTKATTDSALTLLLLKNNILAYNGQRVFEAETYDYKTIHQLLMTQSKKYGNKFVVIIKPADEAPIKATVDMLEEMKICDIKRYAMVGLRPIEKEIIIKFNNSNGR